MIQNRSAHFFVLLCHVALSQYQPDYFVFTAHLRCRIAEKRDFRYQITYWEDDDMSSDDQISMYPNVGNGVDGEVFVNNFGKLGGDTFFSATYEIYVKILHECTSKPGKMREFTIFLNDCLISDRKCTRRLRKDITEQGEELDWQEIPELKYRPIDFTNRLGYTND